MAVAMPQYRPLDILESSVMMSDGNFLFAYFLSTACLPVLFITGVWSNVWLSKIVSTPEFKKTRPGIDLP